MRFLSFFGLLCSLACEGPAGQAGAQGADGADGIDGVDGQDGADGADGSVIVSALVPPGQFLTLDHQLGAGPKLYSAQFQWNGAVYDYRDYAVVRPTFYQDDWTIETGVVDSQYDDVAGATLTDGSHVVYTRGYRKNGDQQVYTGGRFDAGMSKVSSLPEYAWSWKKKGKKGYRSVYELRVRALGSGGYVVSYRGWDGDSDFVAYDMFDSKDSLVSSTTITGDDVGWIDVSALSEGGFAVAWTDYDDKVGDQAAFFHIVDSKGVATPPVALTVALDSSYLRMDTMEDGRLAMVVEVEDPLTKHDSIQLLYVKTDGTIDAQVTLADSYLTSDVSIACNDQGYVLVAAEQGGPDLPFYAVVDADGTLVDGPTALGAWEHDQIAATTFPDGDFWVGVTEDDSNALMTFVIGARGGQLRPMVAGDVRVVPDDEDLAFLTMSDNTIGVLAGSYASSAPSRLTRYSKGVLQIREVGDNEVRLYNETPDPLEITLGAHRTP